MGQQRAYVAAYRIHVQNWLEGKALAEMDIHGFRKDWRPRTIKFLQGLYRLPRWAKNSKLIPKSQARVIP